MGVTKEATEPWVCPHGIKHTLDGDFCKKCLHDAMWGGEPKKKDGSQNKAEYAKTK